LVNGEREKEKKGGFGKNGTWGVVYGTESRSRANDSCKENGAKVKKVDRRGKNRTARTCLTNVQGSRTCGMPIISRKRSKTNRNAGTRGNGRSHEKETRKTKSVRGNLQEKKSS